MPVSEKQKQYNREWDKENMRTVSCRVRTDEYEDFKKYCSMKNTTPGALLKRVVWDCLEEYYDEMERAEKAGKA